MRCPRLSVVLFAFVSVLTSCFLSLESFFCALYLRTVTAESAGTPESFGLSVRALHLGVVCVCHLMRQPEVEGSVAPVFRPETYALYPQAKLGSANGSGHNLGSQFAAICVPSYALYYTVFGLLRLIYRRDAVSVSSSLADADTYVHY